MLAELVSVVIGVDPDLERIHVAAIDATTAGELGSESFPNSPDGHADAMVWADSYSGPVGRAWAIEGAGSYGARLTRACQIAGELVVEFSFPSGPAAPDGAKSDHLDAVRAGREVLGRTNQATPRATTDGAHGSIRSLTASRDSLVRQRTALINTLKAILMAGPEDLICGLESCTTLVLVKRCAQLRPPSDPVATNEIAATKLALKSLAQSIRQIDTAVDELTAAMESHIAQIAPALLQEFGVGPVSAAQILIAWGHQGRIRNADAWGKLSGTAPIEASSGKHQNKHRLNRRGDRALNCALHTIAVSRARHDPKTKAFIAKKISEGKSHRDARRALKRYIGRHLYRILENPPTTP